jgi:integrase
MAKAALTDAGVKRIKPPAKGQADHFDLHYPGLALRISYSGRRSWCYFCRPNGKLTRLTLGLYPSMSLAAAREAWRAARERVQAGDPPKPPPQPKDSIEEVVRDWLERDQKGNASFSLVKQVVEKDVVAPLSGRTLHSITRRDVAAVLDAIVDRGCISHARHVHAYLHRLMRWCVGRGMLDANPMADLPKPGDAVKRERTLSDAEIVALWRAAKAVGWPFGPITQALLLTAARRSEIGELHISELDRTGSCIRLPKARAKNDESRIIPLTPLAWRIVTEGPSIAGSALVFTTNGKTPVSGWSKAKAALDRHTGINEHWTIHDLRRTAATGLERLGTPLQVTEAILGHTAGSKGGVVGIYQTHKYEAEKREALNRWTARVLDLVA